MRFLVEVRTRADQVQAAVVQLEFGRANALFAAILDQVGAHAPSGPVQLVGHRHVHHAQYRMIFVDQRDVHGEFAVAFDELLGAVERIDEPMEFVGAPLFEGDFLIFFRNDRKAVGQLFEPGTDHGIGASVGQGQGRVVGLSLYLHSLGLGIYLQNCLARLAGDMGDIPG